MDNQEKIKTRALNIKRIRLERERAVFMKLGAKLRAYFFTGILVTAPVMITFYVAYKVIMFTDMSVNRLLPPQFKPDNFLPFTIPGLGIIILVAVLIFDRHVCCRFPGQVFSAAGRMDSLQNAVYFQHLFGFETDFRDVPVQ